MAVARRKGLNTKNEQEDQIVVSFPSAVASGEAGRVLFYEIEAIPADGGEPIARWQLAQELHFHPIGRIPATVELVVGADEVPADRDIRFKVSPANCWRTAGRPLTCDFRV